MTLLAGMKRPPAIARLIAWTQTSTLTEPRYIPAHAKSDRIKDGIDILIVGEHDDGGRRNRSDNLRKLAVRLCRRTRPGTDQNCRRHADFRACLLPFAEIGEGQDAPVRILIVETMGEAFPLEHATIYDADIASRT